MASVHVWPPYHGQGPAAAASGRPFSRLHAPVMRVSGAPGGRAGPDIIASFPAIATKRPRGRIYLNTPAGIVSAENLMGEICERCGLPKELCVCDELDRESSRIIVRLERRRFNKPITLLEIDDSKHLDIVDITKTLKKKLACGGSVKDGQIMLQGDHRDKITEYLVGLGFKQDSIVMQ